MNGTGGCYNVSMKSSFRFVIHMLIYNQILPVTHSHSIWLAFPVSNWLHANQFSFVQKDEETRVIGTLVRHWTIIARHLEAGMQKLR